MDESKIITFYSYKGGVGRTMALANVAWLLANKYGRRVLMIDWDLDAPGLHKFFRIPDKKFERGLINIFYDYKSFLQKEVSDIEDEFIDLREYIFKVPVRKGEKGLLSILPAGRFDSEYAKMVNNFDWLEFYEHWRGHGFVEYLRKQFRKNADIVLIDSRTGITDIGGICTLQIPDVVVLVFAFNEQNLSGTEKIAKSIKTKAERVRGDRPAPKILLVPSRVERYLEQNRREEWEVKTSKRLGRYLAKDEQSDFLNDIQRNSIPYVGFYAFGEDLAVVKQPNKELADSYVVLANKMPNGLGKGTDKAQELEQGELEKEELEQLIVHAIAVIGSLGVFVLLILSLMGAHWLSGIWPRVGVICRIVAWPLAVLGAICCASLVARSTIRFMRFWIKRNLGKRYQSKNHY